MKSGDGCSSTCKIEEGYFTFIHTDPDTGLEYTTHASKCGDKIKQPNEDCDDGNSSNGDGCSSDCVVEQGWEAVVIWDNVSGKVYTIG